MTEAAGGHPVLTNGSPRAKRSAPGLDGSEAPAPRKAENGAERPLPKGRYELLLTRNVVEVVAALGSRARVRSLTDDEAPTALALHLRRVVDRVLHSEPSEDRVRRLVDLCNRLITEIETAVSHRATVLSETIARAEVLEAVLGDDAGGLGAPFAPPEAPLTPLSQDAFFANAPHDPRLAGELEREIASADGVDLLCAFITWNGMRVFRAALRDARGRGVPLRVITTTYTGITEPRALQELTNLGAEVKVSYDTRATRLHAKAWLFRRMSGFGTAYLGSSNVTHAALHEGLEWNVRLSQVSSPDLLHRIGVTFDSYWDDQRFEPYEPERFAQAIARERGRTPGSLPDLNSMAAFELRPYPYQEEMLEQLAVERDRHGRWSNLLVAATGTGKTVVAAFDYRRLRESLGDLRVLFVAHRTEILEQSRDIFRLVLRNPGFGELFVGGERPVRGEHVFASIQSLSRVDLDSIAPSYYDMLIIDEFHHAAAPTYDRLLRHLKPLVLLGMTATPERADEIDVTHWFAGRIAAELRLWDALEQGLLCPFQYFGLADVVDLRDVEWRRGGYDANALSNLYTGNNVRASRIVEQVREFVLDPWRMRALGFCVSVEHARFMAGRFNAAGIPAAALSGESDAAERDDVLRRLRAGTLNAVFSVDILNEGLDIPEVDTVLLLRPTESVTVFLQQIGRGLRLAPGKQGLTILDFIGQQRREFRFGPRFEALARVGRSEVLRHVEENFPRLPAGCSIWLERTAREAVIANIRDAARLGRAGLARELAALGDVPLRTFVERTGHDLDAVYDGASGGWTMLRQAAQFPVATGPDQVKLGRAIKRMRHIEDQERVDFYTDILGRATPPRVADLSERQQRLVLMLHFDLWGKTRRFGDLETALARFWEHASLRDELVQLLRLLGDRSERADADPGLGSAVPLRVHQRYTRLEVLAGMGVGSPDHPPESREGVYYVPGVADILLVTLDKDPKHFRPSTRYRDYPLSSLLFHWESQSTTSDLSPSGQRYVHHREQGTSVLLFVRESLREGSESLPFLFLGPAEYRDHRGSRPMAITWRLRYPMPPEFVQQTRAVA